MAAPPKPLTHRIAGRHQVGLSYFFLAGFFTCVILQGFGYLKTDITHDLATMAMLVLSFWFNRQRETVPESASPGGAGTAEPANPTNPQVQTEK